MNVFLKNRPWIFALLIAVFFLGARAGSVAHAASYGSAPHNHDGKICVLSVLGNEDDDHDALALPPAEIVLAKPVFLRPVYNAIVTNCAQSVAINTSARSPPAR